MESLKEVVSSVADWVKNRVTNPFYAAFLFAWLALNWRVVLALASDVPFRAKVSYIDSTLYPGPYLPWIYCFAIPLVSALLYVICSPHVFRVLIRYWRREQLKTRVSVKRDDGLELLSKDEVDEIRHQAYAAMVEKRLLEKKAMDETAEYLTEIARLKEEMEALRKMNSDLHAGVVGVATATNQLLEDGFTSLKNLKIPLPDRLLDALQRRGISPEEVELLRAIDAVGPVYSRERIIAATRHVFTDFAGSINMLKSFRLIEEKSGGWAATQAGTELLQWLELFA